MKGNKVIIAILAVVCIIFGYNNYQTKTELADLQSAYVQLQDDFEDVKDERDSYKQQASSKTPTYGKQYSYTRDRKSVV